MGEALEMNQERLTFETDIGLAHSKRAINGKSAVC
jgi:hypothetical protein